MSKSEMEMKMEMELEDEDEAKANILPDCQNQWQIWFPFCANKLKNPYPN